MLLLVSSDFFQDYFKKKERKFFQSLSTIKVFKGLDPDQDRGSVGPYLGPNCLTRL